MLDLLVVLVRKTGFKWPKGQSTVLHSCLEASNGNCKILFSTTTGEKLIIMYNRKCHLDLLLRHKINRFLSRYFMKY